MNSMAVISFDGINNKSNNAQAECTDNRIKTCSCFFTYAMNRIEKYKPKITKICETMPIIRLGLFGSILNDNYTSESDIDILVLFEQNKDIDHFNNYFELKEKLEEIFNRSVDLVIDKNFRNPYFKKSVEKTMQIIYER